MGLIKSVNDITYELQGQKTEKEIKRREKKRLELIKTKLYNYFEKQFKKDKNAKFTYAEMLKHKELIIDQLKQLYFTKYNVKLDNSNTNYIKQNYFKILNSVKRQYFELERIKQQEEKEKYKQQQEAEKQKEKQQQEAERLQKQNKNQTETLSIGSIIGGITVLAVTIIFLPLLFCLFIISAALKSI